MQKSRLHCREKGNMPCSCTSDVDFTHPCAQERFFRSEHVVLLLLV